MFRQKLLLVSKTLGFRFLTMYAYLLTVQIQNLTFKSYTGVAGCSLEAV